MATLMSYFAPPIAGEWGDEAEDNTDGVPVLRTTNFTADGRLSYDDLTYRSIDTEKKENKILQPGDIIIEKSGGTPKKPVGRCVYFDRDDDYDYFCSNFTAILRANTEDVNTKYLWYLLQEHYKTRQCLKYQYKTNGIANLDIKDYLSHKEVELPPREVQDKRVEAMDYSQYLLDLHQELLEIMDNAVKSRFIEMFGDLGKGSDSENSITLQEMLDRKWITYHLDGNHGGDYPRSHEFIDDGVPYISANCIVNGKIDFSRGKYVSEERANRFRKGIACNKDVLFAHNATVGPVVVLETQYPKVILGTSLTAYRCDYGHIIPEYLKAYMEHPIFIRQYEADMQQTTRKQVPITKQRNYRFIIPEMSYQKDFAAFVEITDKSKLTIQKSMDNLQELRDSLLQEYFG